MLFFKIFNSLFTLREPSKTAADDTFVCLFIYLYIFTFNFRRKYGLMFHVNHLHMKCPVVFSLKNNENIFKTVICCSRD